MKALPRAVVMGASVAVGAGMWAASPVLFGTSEPWHAEGVSYVSALFALGLLGGLARPRSFWLAPAGLFLGQFFFGMGSWVKSLAGYSGGGANFFVPLGAAFLFAYSLAALAGGLLAELLSRLSRKPSNSPPN